MSNKFSSIFPDPTKLVQNILKNPKMIADMATLCPSQEEKNLACAIFNFKEPGHISLDEKINVCCTSIIQAGGMFDGAYSSLLFATFGTMQASFGREFEAATSAVEAVLKQLGGDVRAIYGHSRCLSGTITTAPCFVATPVYGSFNEAILTLMTLDFGTTKEVSLTMPI